jgi:hypothetical protein
VREGLEHGPVLVELRHHDFVAATQGAEQRLRGIPHPLNLPSHALREIEEDRHRQGALGFVPLDTEVLNVYRPAILEDLEVVPCQASHRPA